LDVTKFWREWWEANEVRQQQIIIDLLDRVLAGTIPNSVLRYSIASLVNSYLKDAVSSIIDFEVEERLKWERVKLMREGRRSEENQREDQILTKEEIVKAKKIPITEMEDERVLEALFKIHESLKKSNYITTLKILSDLTGLHHTTVRASIKRLGLMLNYRDRKLYLNRERLIRLLKEKGFLKDKDEQEEEIDPEFLRKQRLEEIKVLRQVIK
jgi:hypothetical protein